MAVLPPSFCFSHPRPNQATFGNVRTNIALLSRYPSISSSSVSSLLSYSPSFQSCSGLLALLHPQRPDKLWLPRDPYNRRRCKQPWELRTNDFLQSKQPATIETIVDLQTLPRLNNRPGVTATAKKSQDDNTIGSPSTRACRRLSACSL